MVLARRLLRSRVILLVGPALICLVLAAILFASGSNDLAPETAASSRISQARAAEQGPPAYLVTDKQVKAEPQGSPQRAALEWWQAIQYIDVRSVHEALTPRLQSRHPLSTLGRQLNDAVGGFSSAPRVAGVSTRGNDATVRLNLAFQGAGSVTVVLPRSIAMTRIAGTWRIADVRYLSAEAAKGRAAREAASRSARGR